MPARVSSLSTAALPSSIAASSRRLRARSDNPECRATVLAGIREAPIACHRDEGLPAREDVHRTRFDRSASTFLLSRHGSRRRPAESTGHHWLATAPPCTARA